MIDNEKVDEVLFYQLVMGLHGSAWMMLGKVANPMTGGVERNLEAARATIDTLAMLKAKTVGNLSEEEEAYLSNILQQLQLNYVDELGRSKVESVSRDEAGADVKEEKPAEEPSAPKESKPKEEKKKNSPARVKGKKKTSKK